ncbi:hypothetical protein KR026_010356 [Drosophila bipectinata]|nr:hypothetical protein KR026_010356 [Drosophila bipectinata]
MSPRPRNTHASLESRYTRGIQSYRCRVCNGIHALKKCRRFPRLSAEKRLRAVLVNRYCSSCLAHKHSDGSCRRGDGCKTCGQDHHTLLHLVEKPRARRKAANSRRVSGAPRPGSATFRQSQLDPRPPTSRHSSLHPRPSSATPRLPTTAHPPASSAPRQKSASRRGPPLDAVAAPTLSSLLQRNSVNVLPTALVRIDTGTRSFDTGALIDPCTPSSCIDASLAACFRQPTTNVGDEQVCSATVGSSTDDSVRLEVMFKIELHVRVRTPSRELSEAVRAHFRGVTLADERFHLPATISVVLGADMYPRIIQPGFLKIQDGLPVAQSTVFGWVVSGACHQP